MYFQRNNSWDISSLHCCHGDLHIYHGHWTDMGGLHYRGWPRVGFINFVC